MRIIDGQREIRSRGSLARRTRQGEEGKNVTSRDRPQGRFTPFPVRNTRTMTEQGSDVSKRRHRAFVSLLIVFAIAREATATTINLRENAPPNAIIFEAAQLFANRSLTTIDSYEILDGEYDHLFAIEPASGAISTTTNASLDYEDARLRLIRLHVIGRDRLRRESYGVSLTIRLVDVDDAPPRFESPSRRGYVRENVAAGVDVAGLPRVAARDDVVGGDVRAYRVVGRASALFDVRRIGAFASLRTRVRLDRERNASIDVILEAIDASNLTQSVRFEVVVIDENDNAPAFEPIASSFSVSESAPVGTSVFQVEARDLDEDINGRIYYLLESGGGGDSFSCHPQLGVVSVAKALDYESASSHSLVIVARDRGMPSLSSTIKILVNVTDANEEPPVFVGPTSLNVNDNLPAMSSISPVLSLTDSDALAGEDMTLDVISGDPREYFRVGSQSKSNSYFTFPLLVNRRLDEDVDHPTSFLLTLRARDGGNPTLSSTFQIRIDVKAVNSPPMFLHNVYEVTISEELPRLSQVVWAKAVDYDEGSDGVLTYVDTSGVTKFRVERKTGLVLVHDILDRELEDMYSFTVTVSDDPGLKATAQVIIHISDANDNSPKFSQQEYRVGVREDVQQASFFHYVTATDADIGTNGELHYSIVNSTSPGTLEINEFNGGLWASSLLDYEKVSSIGLVVRCEDRGTPFRRSADVPVIVSILNANDNPPEFVPASYACIVYENGGSGNFCIQVAVQDKDGPNVGQMKFTIVDGDPESKFTVTADGKLITTGALDREEEALYTLIVAVNDGENDGLNNATVIVTVGDRDDDPPRFDKRLYITLVEANAAPDTVFITVNASTRDVGPQSVIRYFFNPRQSVDPFYVDPFSGEIRVRSVPTANVTLNVTISAENKAGLGVSRVVLIVVAGNKPPYFDSGPVDRRVVAEDAAIGSVAATVSATDPEGSKLTYALDRPSSEFSVDESGIVRVVGNLNGGVLYDLLIQVNDSGFPPKSSFQTLKIQCYVATGQPNNRPQFESTHYYSEVTESFGTGASVITVSVSDGSGGGSSPNYTIVSEEPSSNSPLFQIDSSGLITLTRVIDREISPVYFLTVRVSKASLSSRCSVTISVDDVDDRFPRFSQPTIRIPENIPAHSRVYKMENIEADSPENSKVTFSMQSSLFDIDKDLGYITITQSILDRNGQGLLQTISVLVTDSKSRSTTLRLPVVYEDVNNKPPEFLPNSFTETVAETLTPGTLILHLSATDKDFNTLTNGRITYEITEGNEGGAFFIEPDTGILSSQVSLDYEITRAYNLVVQARDNGINPLTATASVEIRVTNKNDVAPVFLLPSRTVEIVSSASSVTTVEAVDGDKDSIRYSLTGSSSFAIDPISGQISARSPAPGRYTLTVSAVDQFAVPSDRLTTNTQIVVVVVNKNRSPSFSAISDVSANEDFPLGKVLLTDVSSAATDPDSGYAGRLLFSITDGNEDAKFLINPYTGELSLQDNVDYEKRINYSLTVAATDSLRLSSSAALLVKILDVNDNAPEIQSIPQSLSVLEDSPRGTVVLSQIVATDADEGNNGRVRYRLTNDVLSAFKVDDTSGRITVNGQLDRETTPVYELHIDAYDLGVPKSLSSSAVLRIDLRDVADTPPLCFLKNIRIEVPEDYPRGVVLNRIACLELDNDTLRYSLSKGNASLFAVDRLTGSVRLISSLMNLIHKQQSISVEASNSQAQNLAAVVDMVIVVVRVGANLHWPVFSSIDPFPVGISEGSPIGSFVAIVSSHDADAGPEGDIRYSLIGGTGVTKFAVNAKTGEIQTTDVLDYEKQSEYYLTIAATDQGSPPKSSTLIVHIAVLDVNDNAPQFEKASYVVDDHSGFPNVFVAVAVADDADSAAVNRLTYSISKGNTSFVIDSQSGLLANGPQGLNRDFYNPVQTASIRVTDSAFFDSAQLFVSLANVDNNQPIFYTPNPYNVEMYPNIPTGWPIVQVVAWDEDRGPDSVISYALRTVQSSFAINGSSGIVTLTPSATPTASALFRLQVQASSGGNAPISVTSEVNISVRGVRQKRSSASNVKPSFSSSHLRINVSENYPVGNFLPAGVTAFHPDDALILYRVSPQLGSGDVLAVHPNTGKLRLAAPLDREARSVYRFDVTAFDGRNFSHALLTLAVDDVNDNWPTFTDAIVTPVTVLENSKDGTFVARLTADDIDEGSNGQIDFSIAEPGNGIRVPFVVSQDGVVTTSGLIDRETTAAWIVKICAEDKGSPPKRNCTQIRIDVLDVNDNAPDFGILSIVLYAEENASPGFPLRTVHAIDPDAGANGVVVYSLTPATNLPFDVNETTGRLSVSGLLDYESQRAYNFSVVASDRGNPSMNSSLRVTVNVDDVLDSGPLWTQARYYGSVTENGSPGLSVAVVSAESGDPVEYEILHDPCGCLLVGSFSGLVYTSKALDREYLPVFNASIQSCFAGRLCSSVNLTVTVEDKNDNNPRFIPSIDIVVNVSERAQLGQKVASFDVVDSDEGENANISLAFVDPPPVDFNLNSLTGDLTLSNSLDRETKDTIVFRIKAKDHGKPSLQTTANVIVNVLDANDHIPVFSQVTYSTTIITPLPVNTSIIRVSASDADIGAFGTVSYSIVAGNDDGRIAVDETTGVLFLFRNYDLKSFYSLTVQATDGGGLKSTSTVRITVEEKIGSVAFSHRLYAAVIRENLPDNTGVVNVSAIDYLQSGASKLTYSIVTPTDAFRIDSARGSIVTTRPLDRENVDFYHLIVEAVAVSDPPRLAQASVDVDVLDTNDNSPKFGKSRYQATVKQSSSVGHEIIRLQANDPDDGLNSELVYDIVSSTSDKFSIDRKLGTVGTLSSLQGLAGQSFTLEVRVRDSGSPPLNDTATLTIFVVDVDAPQFNASSFAVDVAEDNMPGTLVTQLVVSINPSPRQLKYTIETGDNDQHFLLDSISGRLSVAGVLDYETVKNYSLLIQATDPGATSLYARVVLNITVLDVNDNDPIFSQNVYVISRRENASIGAELIRVSANDADSGSLGTVHYSLQSDVNGTFAIDGVSGAITVAKSLDADTVKEYRFDVQAADGGKPARSSFASVRVVPININDNPPQFASSPVISVSVDENAPVDATVSTIQATDVDGDVVTYGVDFDGADGRFALDSRTGTLLVRRSDLGRPIFRLVVFATDGTFNTSVNLTVNVNDINDHRPQFSAQLYNGRVTENAATGTFVIQVNATDDDFGTNGQITYSFTGSGSDFRIDPSTGRVSTRSSSLDREKQAVYNLKVKALDGGGDAGFADLVVTLGDLNDNSPTFQRCNRQSSCQSTLDILESTKRGDVVVALSATDEDAGRNAAVTYNISFSDSADVLLEVQSSGNLVAARDLSGSGGKSFSMTVMATDGGNPSRSGSIDLTVRIVRDQDSPPQFVTSSYSASVKELDLAGTNVTVVCAGDPTPNGQGVTCPSVNRTVEYNIVSQSTPISYFEVDTFTGRITVASGKRVPDIHTLQNKPVQLIVAARYQNNFRFSNYAGVTVTVVDVNNNKPKFVEFLFTADITENNKAGAFVLNVEATDLDTGSNAELRYYIRSSDSSLPFEIDRVSGNINATAVLDYEDKNDYIFRVYAEDLGSPRLLSDDRTVIISVKDENDNPPVFDQPSYEKNIKENAQISSLVLTVSANDADAVSKNKLVYSIDSGNDGGAFEIKSSGDIVVAASLDRERQLDYEMSVSVSDGKFTTSTSVDVNLDDVNDEAPDFAPIDDQSLPEDAPTSTVVVRVTASDADIGDNAVIRYAIDAQRPANAFGINSTSGDVFVNSSLDYESVTSYALDVVAFNPNNENMRDVASFRIGIVDVNDNAPIFRGASLDVSVLENSDVLTDVGQVKADDKDSGLNGKIVYSLLDDVNGTFLINLHNGRIWALRTLDRESRSAYHLRVRAADSGVSPLSSTASVTVSVTDVNDNSPVFDVRPVYRANASEALDLQKTIVVISATDADLGTNAEVQYSIVNPNSFPNFRLDSKTGALLLTQRLDFEQVQSYEITVRADDGGFPVLSQTTRLIVNVTDVNDNAPRFAGTPYTTKVREDLPPGDTVFTLTATDRDSSSNAELFFDIVDGNVDGAFNVDAGEIVVAKSLDRETRDEYTIRVRVRDGGTPSLSATTEVVIGLNDVNDNYPQFTSRNIGEVQENSPGVKEVAVLSASDEDLGTNAEITFGIVGDGIGGLFVLVSGNRIRTNGSSFDREEKKEYLLNVSATDGGSPSLTTYAIVTVVIGDVDDNEPRSVFRTMYLNYLEPFALGEIGVVGIYDPDDDDQLNYAIVNDAGSPFKINSRTGALISPRNPPAGKFNLTVSASWENQVLNDYVLVIVTPVTQEMISSSVTIRLNMRLPDDFLSLHYDAFVGVVSDVMNVDRADVFVLSVQTAAQRSSGLVDVVFAVRRSGSNSYYLSELLRSEIFLNQHQIEQRLDDSNIVLFDIDPCVPEPCLNGTCSSRFVFGQSYDTVSVPSAWFRSLHQSRSFACACFPGFTGDDCGDGSYDFCFSSPCQNEGNCTSGSNGFTCDCPTDVSGETCQTKARFCDSNPCLNLGKCVERLRSFECECEGRFTGPQCEQALFKSDGCQSKPECAANGGECTSGPSGTTCFCGNSGKAGPSCEWNNATSSNVTTCAQNPCLYGGTCIDLKESFECECSIGFIGERCETDVNECLSNPCVFGTCQNGHGGYQCTCKSEERYTGRNCETDLTACVTSPCASEPSKYCVAEPGNENFACVPLCNSSSCLHGGTCTPKDGTVTCECPPGLEGPRCELTGASFDVDSFIMFPSLRRRESGSVEFEFVTDDLYGLLLYNGRYDVVEEDFLLVALIGGYVQVTYKVGGDLVVVRLPQGKSSKLNDRQWHSVKIEWKGTVRTKNIHI